MDVWGWVRTLRKDLRKEGQDRLVELLDELPSAACNDRHAEVDALVPEALALVRSLSLPWAEVFVRHWSLQSRVLHRMDATALPEALRLLDFAHDGAARGCPQAVCVVQDLGNCYAQVDGPGYAEERLAVSSEALAGIDPSWACFECITGEYAAALLDLGRGEDALAFCEAQERAARETEPTAFAARFRELSAALVQLGRHEEALTVLVERGGRRTDAHSRREIPIHKALVLCRLGRTEEALAAFPSGDDVMITPVFYWSWAQAAQALVEAGALPNDAALGRTLSRMMTRLSRQGVGRTVLELGEMAGHLAVARGSEIAARRALAAMEASLPRLAKHLDALDRLGKLRAAIAAMPERDEETPEALLAWLSTAPEPSPEEALPRLEAGRRRSPDHAAIALATWSALSRLGLDEEARASLDPFATAHPEETSAALALGQTLITLDDREAHAALAARLIESADPSDGHWLLAQGAMAQHDYARAVEHGLAVLALCPEAINTRRLVHAAAHELRNWPLALRMARELSARSPDPGPADWARVVAGSGAGAWDEVRESAKRLGLGLEGEGPIDEHWEICRLRFEDPRAEVFARRRGPATAEVVQICGPAGVERFGDLVLFEPSPVDEDQAEGASESAVPRLFPALDTLRRAGARSHVLDGVHPGEEAVEALRATLRAEGVAFQVNSGEGYQLEPEGSDAPVLGLYAFLALPATLSARDASALLRRATAGWAAPVTWLGLAEEAEDTELVEEQQATAQRLGL